MRPRRLSCSKQCCQVNEQIKCNWWSLEVVNFSQMYWNELWELSFRAKHRILVSSNYIVSTQQLSVRCPIKLCDIIFLYHVAKYQDITCPPVCQPLPHLSFHQPPHDQSRLHPLPGHWDQYHSLRLRHPRPSIHRRPGWENWRLQVEMVE